MSCLSFKRFFVLFVLAGISLFGSTPGAWGASPQPGVESIFPSAVSPVPAGAGSTTVLPLDLDRGVVRSINIEEAWVENAIYFHSINADDLSAGNNWSLSGELDFAFNSWLGGEFDFPVFLMTYPLGSGPSAFGPITAGIRVVPYQAGSEVSRQAAILSVEVEGNWWPTPQVQNFPGEGDSVSAEFLWAYRYHRVYFQGITGYTMPVGPGAVANPFFQVSTGRTWEGVWALQLETDVNGAVPMSNGKTVSVVSVIPEVAYMPFGDIWLNEIGEGLSVYGSMGPQPTTYFMMEYEFHGF